MSASVSLSSHALATPVSVVSERARDLRLDFFRGLALLMIFINHTSGNIASSITLQRLGFADAAEMFVLIAGIAATFAYRKVYLKQGLSAAFGTVLRRVRLLYGVHLVLAALALVIAAGALWGGSGFDMTAKLGLQPLLDDPVAALVRLPFLMWQPHYLDILPLYIVLLLLLPLVLAGFRHHVLLPLGVALVSYAVVQATDMNLPDYGDARGWFLNPFAWVLLFVVGATIAELTVRGFWVRLPRLFVRAVTVLAGMWVVVALGYAAPWTLIPGLETVFFPDFGFAPDKVTLSWHRLADILAKVWLVAVLVPAGSLAFRMGMGGVLSSLGRHSLPVFAAGIILSLLASLAIHATEGDLGAQLVINATGIALLAGLAWWLDGARARALGPVRLA